MGGYRRREEALPIVFMCAAQVSDVDELNYICIIVLYGLRFVNKRAWSVRAVVFLIDVFRERL